MHEHGHPERSFRCDAPPTANADYCSREQRRLIISIVITGIAMLLEVAGGIWSGSLALLSDAGHMFSHLFALGVSYAAILLACRPPTEAQSFGFYRAEILAALANGVTLVLIAAWIVYEAWERLRHPAPVHGSQMFVIAVIGLVVNAVTALLLKDASQHDLNIRGAFLHVLGDLGSSVGVILAAIVIWLTGWTALDPIVSVLIALLILWWSGRLMWDATRVLLQSTPRHLSRDAVAQALIENIEEIRSVHHIHIWELTSRMYVMTAHVEVDDMPLAQVSAIRERALALLCARFDIRHGDLQFEVVSAGRDGRPTGR